MLEKSRIFQIPYHNQTATTRKWKPMRGIIKRIVEDRRFGFIRSANDKTEYFFHASEYKSNWDELVQDYEETQVLVEFDRVESSKGPRAENVRRIGG